MTDKKSWIKRNWSKGLNLKGKVVATVLTVVVGYFAKQGVEEFGKYMEYREDQLVERISRVVQTNTATYSRLESTRQLAKDSVFIYRLIDRYWIPSKDSVMQNGRDIRLIMGQNDRLVNEIYGLKLDVKELREGGMTDAAKEILWLKGQLEQTAARSSYEKERFSDQARRDSILINEQKGLRREFKRILESDRLD